MSVDYDAWIGFGVEVKFKSRMLGHWPKKYDGWGEEEVLEDLLNLPSSPTTVAIRNAGSAYTGKQSCCLLAKSSWHAIRYDVTGLGRITDSPNKIAQFAAEVTQAIEKLIGLDWIEVVGPACWIGGMWMH